MRKIFQRNILPLENKPTLSKNRNNNFRPFTSFKKAKGPIKLIDERILYSANEQDNPNNFFDINNTNNTNNTNINHYNSNINNNSEYEDLFLSREETDKNQTQNIFPMLSKTESNIFKKRVKSASDKLKIKLQNISNMFKNEPKYYLTTQKRIVFKHRGLMPGIPRDLLSRLIFVFKLFRNSSLITYIQKAPSNKKCKIDKVTDYLWAYNNSDHTYLLDFYAIFFYYLCINIQYDINGKNKNEKKLDVIFKSGLANSLQFCQLYEHMCKRNFLRIKRIEGFCKSKELPYYKKGSDVSVVNHYWNAIYVNKEWYFCDLTFGSGGIRPREEYKKSYFNPYFFLTPSDNLIETHRPIDDIWQLSTKIIPINQFSNTREINYGDFYKQIFDHSINTVTHKYPIIKCENKFLFIKIGVKDMAIQALLYNVHSKSNSYDVKFSFDSEESTFTLEPVFPTNGEYILEILFRQFGTNEVQYLPLINYRIIVDDSQEKYIENLRKQKKIFSQKQKLFKESKSKRPKSVAPNISRVLISRDQIQFTKRQIKICLDNEGAHLISPSSNNIKIGQINDFKVKVPNSVAVCILDGRNWNYLKKSKKDKNLWFGSFEIKNENIVVLSMKENKIYTEVFQLKAHHVASNLLRLTQQKKEHFKSTKNFKKLKNDKYIL